MDYGGNPDGATLTSDGFRGDGSFGPPYFYLGLRGPNFRGFSSADGTMDELAFLTRTTDMNQSSLLASSRFPAGRYCKEDEALVPARPEYTSCPIVLGKGVRLTRVDWTLNLPREPVRPPGVPAEQWTDPSQILYGTGAVPSVGETADATVTLLDAAGNPLVPSRLTKPGSAVGVDLPSGTFKVGVNLRPRLGDNAAPWDKPSAPLLESPVLDDLTFTYTPVQGPRILSWRP